MGAGVGDLQGELVAPVLQTGGIISVRVADSSLCEGAGVWGFGGAVEEVVATGS